MGSSAPKTPTNTTQTINTNSIPDFMQPYFNTMMNSAQGQVYQRDAQGNVTGLQPYQPYSTNPNDYVAPLSGLQNQAIQGAGNLQVPGQFQQGSQMVGGSGAGALGIGMQAANAGNQYNQMATDPNALKGFMSPYMQNVVNYETGQANRQYDITGQEQQAAAARSGAFGGSREAIMGAENERNRNQAITGIQSTGAEKAFQNAQQAQQFGANLGMQGYDTGIRGMNAGIQAGMGLGTLGAGQLGAQRDILNTQAQFGSMQQDQQQKVIDAALNNYTTAQQYPQQQMNWLSGLIRGFPVTQTGSTQQNYQAQPNMMSQLFGGISAMGSMYNAYKKEGGIVGYNVGGAIESDLDQMNPEQLQEIIQTTTSDIERQMAKKLLAEKTMAGGGIVAFAQGGSMREQMDRISQEMTAKDYKAHGWTEKDIKNYKSTGKIPIDPKKQLALRTPEVAPDYPGGKGDYARQMEDFQRQSRLVPESDVINLPDENVTPRAGRTATPPPYRPLGIANPDIPGGPVEAELSGRNLPPPTSEGEVLPRRPAPAGLGAPERPPIEGQTGKLHYGEFTEKEYRDRMNARAEAMKNRTTAAPETTPTGPTPEQIAEAKAARANFVGPKQPNLGQRMEGIKAAAAPTTAPAAPAAPAAPVPSLARRAVAKLFGGGNAVDAGTMMEAANSLVDRPAEEFRNPELKAKLLEVFPHSGDFTAPEWAQHIKNAIGEFVSGPKYTKPEGIAQVASPAEQPTINQPAPLQAEPAPASIAQVPQDQGTMIPTGGIDQYGGGGDNYAPQGASQGIPQAAGSPYDPMIAESKAKLEALPTADAYKTPEALLQRRQEIMSQRANTADESRRQMNLRMADFFAHWGSTPGPVISAGLKALTETMPGFLKDKKDQEELSRALSEAQFQIDWADHLEHKGETEKAAAVRAKAADDLSRKQELKVAAEAKFAQSAMEQGQQNLRTTQNNSTELQKTLLGGGEGKWAQNQNQMFGTRERAHAQALDAEKTAEDWADISPEERTRRVDEHAKHLLKTWGAEDPAGGTAQAAPDVSKYVEKYKLSPADARSYMDWEASQRGG